jgi:hypothetical protein
MIPQTADQFYTTLHKTLWTRLYLDLSTAARSRRLTEHDIAGIERTLLDFRRDTDAFASEFETFETEPIVAAVFNEFEQLFAIAKLARIKKLQGK